MQIEPQGRLFLCSIEQTVKEWCIFRMGGFPVRISHKVVYKINKSASLHPLQILLKNNIIPRRFSNTSENFGRNNLKQG